MLVMGSDGLWDNLWEEEVEEAVLRRLRVRGGCPAHWLLPVCPFCPAHWLLPIIISSSLCLCGERAWEERLQRAWPQGGSLQPWLTLVLLLLGGPR